MLTRLPLLRPVPSPETGSSLVLLLQLSHSPRAWVPGSVLQSPALQVSVCTLRSSMAALDLLIPNRSLGVHPSTLSYIPTVEASVLGHPHCTSTGHSLCICPQVQPHPRHCSLGWLSRASLWISQHCRPQSWGSCLLGEFSTLHRPSSTLQLSAPAPCLTHLCFRYARICHPLQIFTLLLCSLVARVASFLREPLLSRCFYLW